MSQSLIGHLNKKNTAMDTLVITNTAFATTVGPLAVVQG
jgi:hypothetical protein